jgi:NADPH-dependent 2,4-dienoyl-CoA reductase/sulfur reductase-like enzyme
MLKKTLEVVVVGGIAAGPKFAMSLRRRMPNAKITLLEKGEHLSFGACVLPYYISGEVPDITMLTKTPLGEIRNSEFFKKTGDIEALVYTEAIKIDRKQKTVIVRTYNKDRSRIDEKDLLKIQGNGFGLDEKQATMILSDLEKVGYLKDGMTTDKLVTALVQEKHFLKKENISKTSIKFSHLRESLEQLLLEKINIRSLPYDKLFLATGTVPLIPPFKCQNNNEEIRSILDFDNAFTLRSIADGTSIVKNIRQYNVSRITIIGGGLIGVEVAAAIKDFNLDLSVSIVERKETILSEVIEPELAKFSQEYLRLNGIRILTSTTVQEIHGHNGKAEVSAKFNPSKSHYHT